MAEFEELEAIYQTEKGKAVCLDIDGTEVWVPKSVLEHEGDELEDAERGDHVDVSIKTWFAKKEGLI